MSDNKEAEKQNKTSIVAILIVAIELIGVVKCLMRMFIDDQSPLGRALRSQRFCARYTTVSFTETMTDRWRHQDLECLAELPSKAIDRQKISPSAYSSAAYSSVSSSSSSERPFSASNDFALSRFSVSATTSSSVPNSCKKEKVHLTRY